jgi:hypothetical protein
MIQHSSVLSTSLMNKTCQPADFQPGFDALAAI